MEDWEHQVEIVKVTVHEVPQQVHTGKLEMHGLGFEYGDQPLEIKVSDRREPNRQNYVRSDPKLLPVCVCTTCGGRFTPFVEGAAGECKQTALSVEARTVLPSGLL